MFDDYNELSVNQFLKVPDEQEHSMVSDLLKEEYKEEEEEEFFDTEFLVQIRREIAADAVEEKGTAGTDVIPVTKTRFPLVRKLLKLLFGWQDFAGLSAEFEKGIILETGEEKVNIINTLSREQELIEQQISQRQMEEGRTVIEKKEKEPLSPFKFTQGTVKKIGRMLLKFKKNYINSNYVLSIDIGRDSLKYTLIRTDKSELILESYGIEDYVSTGQEKDDTEKISQALRKLLSKNYTDFSDTLVTISGITRHSKIITIPKVAQKELKDLILFNLRKDSAFQTNEEMDVEYYLMGTREEKEAEKYDMLVVWAPLEQINKYYNLIKESGIIPAKITFPETGPWEYCKYFMSDTINAGGILFDIGFASTFMIFYDQCLIKFVREIKVGSRHFTEALVGTYSTPQGNVDVGFERAEILKQNFGIPPSDNTSPASDGITYAQINMQLSAVLNKYISEITRSINYYRSQYHGTGLQTISLSGGGALLLHLDEYIAEATGLEIKRVSLFDKMRIGEEVLDGYNLSRNYHKLINSVGIALEEQDVLNFLPEEAKNVKKRAQAGLLFIAVFAVMFIGMSVLSVGKIQDSARLKSTFLEKKQQWESVDSEKKMYASLVVEKDGMVKKRNDMAEKIKGVSGKQKTETILKIISNVIPSSVFINSAVYTEGSENEEENIVLEGNVSDTDKAKVDILFNFYLRLEQSGYFSRVIVNEENDKKTEESMELPDFIITCYF